MVTLPHHPTPQPHHIVTSQGDTNAKSTHNLRAVLGFLRRWIRSRRRRACARYDQSDRRTVSSITTTAKPPAVVTFTVADYTEIDKAGKVAGLKDLRVGDRVVVEIPKGKTEAESIQVGAAPAAASATHPAEHQHKP